MKSIISVMIAFFLLSVPVESYSQTMGGMVGSSSSKMKLDTDCKQTMYYSLGVQCQDTDDAKVYVGNGVDSTELAAGSTGDVTAVTIAQTWGNGTDPVVWTFSVTDADPVLTFTAAQLSLGAANLLTTGSVGATGTRVLKGWFTNLEVTGWPSVNGDVVFDQAVKTTSTPTFASATLSSAASLTLGTQSLAAGGIILHNATNANHFTITSGVSDPALAWTLPPAAPGGANYLLNVDADGTMGYTNPADFLIAGDTTWAAKGDLIVGTANDTAAVLSIGTSGQVLNVASGTAAWTSTLTGTIGGFTATLGSVVIADAAGDLTDTTASAYNVLIGENYISIGANPADAGSIRLPNAGYIMSEADAAGDDISVIGVDSAEVIQIGASGASGVTITPSTTITGDLTVTGADLTLGTGIKLTGGAGVLTLTDLAGTIEVAAFDLRTENTLKITTSSGVTDVNIGTLNLVATGTISGRIPVVPDTDGRPIPITEISGHVHFATGTGTWTLPAMAAANGTGWSMCLYSTTNDDVHFDVEASDKFRYDGALKTAGKKLTISDTGAYICVVLTDYDTDIAHWTVFGTNKTVTPEAD